MEGRLGTVWYRHQVVGAERLTASIAVELIATSAEHRAASGTGVGFQEDVAAVFVVFDWQAVEERIAGGTGRRVVLFFSCDLVCLTEKHIVKLDGQVFLGLTFQEVRDGQAVA